MQNRSKGIVLPIVLIIMLILSILGMAILNRSSFDNKAEKVSEDKMQAHYLARSGLEVGKKIINNSTLSYSNQNFYFYGDLNNDASVANWTLKMGALTTADENHPIVVKSVLVSDNDYKMTAKGTYRGQVDTIVYNFTVGASSSATLTNVPGNALDASSTEVGWVQSANGKIIHDGTETVPVSFYGNNKVITLESRSATLEAPALYFTDTDTSLEVTNNSDLTLKTNFVSFAGDVLLSGNKLGQLILNINSTTPSTLNGSAIGGNNGKIYGLIYFHKKVLYKTTDSGLAAGYYYFQNDIDLQTAIASAASAKLLIPISDPTAVTANFNALHTGISGAGITAGSYGS